jgi:hypothetical protein
MACLRQNNMMRTGVDPVEDHHTWLHWLMPRLGAQRGGGPEEKRAGHHLSTKAPSQKPLALLSTTPNVYRDMHAIPNLQEMKGFVPKSLAVLSTAPNVYHSTNTFQNLQEMKGSIRGRVCGNNSLHKMTHQGSTAVENQSG